MSASMRWFLVVSYAAAMAWVEAAVVVDLRVLIDRLEPYQPNPLPVSVGLGQIEIVRELATMIMIGTVAVLAGRTWRGRLGTAMLIFGVWDILYYVFLRPMSNWPRSLLDWDILFLLPLPWWGPVLAPSLIAALLALTGTLLLQCDNPTLALWPGARAWAASVFGVVLALYVFMADAIAAMNAGVEAIRQVLPTEFNWAVFGTALVLLAAPSADIIRQWANRASHWEIANLVPVFGRMRR